MEFLLNLNLETIITIPIMGVALKIELVVHISS